ncbi:MAG TPA: CpsB/CapC family capsule biosynthesis tyrosine phosphatase [Solirubrobacteraceae bacterium]
MIDIHCHILPGLDDGPGDLDGSLALAERAAAAGIETIVATPHIREDHPFPPAVVGDRVASLNAELRAAGSPVSVVPGGELAITRVAELDDATLHDLCLGAGRYGLVESPYTDVGGLLEQSLFDLQTRDVRPVLAHPERSPSFIGEAGRVEELVERGVLMSVTAASLAGRFGSTVRDFSLELFERGLIHNVATDAHDARRRPPELRPAFESLQEDFPGALEQAAWYTEDAPRAMLAGEALPPRPDPPKRRGRRGLLRRARRG